MKLATTTCDFDGYADGYLAKLRHVAEAGFRYIDLSLYTVEPDDALLLSDDWEKNLDDLQACAAELGLTFVQCHSPNTNPIDPTQAERAVAWNRRSIEICGRLGIQNMVVHSGWDPQATREDWYVRNKHFFTQLFDAMEKWNVNVLHENTTSANMPWFYPKTGAEMRAFSEYVHHPLFHSCWDTGHGNVEGAQYDQILAMGDDLRAVHINDNRGAQDEHVIPYFGTVNMDEILHALIDVGFRGPFVFESGSTLRPSDCWVGARHAFPRDTRLAEPTLAMQKSLEKFMFDVGAYMLTTYGLYEE